MFGADNIAKLMEKDWNDFVVEVDIDDQKKNSTKIATGCFLYQSK